MEPFLIRVFQRGGQGRHDLAAVPEVAPYLSPLFLLAHTLEATSCFDGFLELVQIQWPLIDTGETCEAMAMLFVEFCELVQVI